MGTTIMGYSCSVGRAVAFVFLVVLEFNLSAEA